MMIFLSSSLKESNRETYEIMSTLQIISMFNKKKVSKIMNTLFIVLANVSKLLPRFSN